MFKVGITGGIGSGKTTVAKVFEVLGIPVYYADDAAKKLMVTSPIIREKLTAAFGAETYTGEILNRSYLAEQVFGNEEKLQILNSIVHPETLADAAHWMEIQTSAYVIKEAALMYESDAHRHIDFMIGVAAPLALRIERTMHRDGLTAAAVEERIARQLPQEEKMSRCDFVINNDGMEMIIPQVLEVHAIILSKL